MLRLIPVHFQWFSLTPGRSTRHTGDMQVETRRREAAEICVRLGRVYRSCFPQTCIRFALTLRSGTHRTRAAPTPSSVLEIPRLGVRLEATEAVLNHTSGSRGGIAGVYRRRHDWAAEKRAALGERSRTAKAAVV